VCSFQEAREAVSSSLSEVYLLRGIFGSCLGLGWFSVLCFSLSCCVFLHISFPFCKFSFYVEVDSISACQRLWLSVPEAFFRTRLSVCDCILVFRHTRGLLRFSPRIPALCSGTTRGYMRAVLVTVAGLLGIFSAWVGHSSPPVVRRAPLRGLESKAAQSAG
jgi:hypothetical protein